MGLLALFNPVDYTGIVFIVDPADHEVLEFERYLYEISDIFPMIGPLTQQMGYPLEFIGPFLNETYPIVMHVNKTSNILKYTLLGDNQRTVEKVKEFVLHMSKPAPSVKPEPPQPNSSTTNSLTTRAKALNEKTVEMRNKLSALLRPKSKEKLTVVSGDVLSSAATGYPLTLSCTKIEPVEDGEAPRYMCT